MRSQRTLDSSTLEKMRDLVTARTDEALNARFGISYNTWRKLMMGEPIRASVADRLIARIDQLAKPELASQSRT